LPGVGTSDDLGPGPPSAPSIGGNPPGTVGLLCAPCHNADLSDEPDWKIPKADGTYPAPAHDSRGHTWHHPDQLLLQIIREGLDIPGTTMPTFGDKLTDPEILSIIEYLRSNRDPEQRSAQWQVTWQESQ
jgi:mono/diheme cytochrome c family protein